MINIIHIIGHFFIHLRIPTILGLGILLLGTGAGVFLVSQPQNPLTQASKNSAPEEIIVSNINDQSVTISWKTQDPVTGTVKYGITSNDEQTALDNRDKTSNPPRLQERTEHYVTIEKLTPNTTYQFVIESNGEISDDNRTFITGASTINKNTLPPLIGTVTYSGLPISQGIAYLNIPGAITQSAIVTQLGSFTIPLAKVYNQDLQDVLTLTPNTHAELKIIAPQGIATAKILLNNLNQPLKPLIIGQNEDFTNLPVQLPTPLPSSSGQPLQQFDLNSDGSINAADEAIIKRNYGNNPQNKQADVTNDGEVNDEDLNLVRDNFTFSINQ